MSAAFQRMRTSAFAVALVTVLLCLAALCLPAPSQAATRVAYDNIDASQAGEGVWVVKPSGDKTGTTDRLTIRQVELGIEAKYAQAYDLPTCTNQNKKITIKLVSGKKYYFDGPLPLFDNLTLDATGATITQKAVGKGFGINARYYGSEFAKGVKTGGYNRCKNITITGGTWVGTTKPDKTKTKKYGWYSGYSAFLFMHGKNVTIQNATITNNYNGHCIEFAGVKKGVIKNCTFKGKYVGDTTNEVIQLDTNYNSSVSPTGYPWDGTPCKNVKISGCKFKIAMPVGIGTNYQCKKQSSNITISKCTFTKVKKYAVALYKCKTVKISGSSIKKGRILKHSTASGVKLGSAEKKKLA